MEKYLSKREYKLLKTIPPYPKSIKITKVSKTLMNLLKRGEIFEPKKMMISRL